MYNYENEKQSLFTEEGQVKFLKIRDNVHDILKIAGAVRLDKAINVGTGDNWQRIACVDRLVELNEIREITKEGTAGQDRVFVSSK